MKSVLQILLLVSILTSCKEDKKNMESTAEVKTETKDSIQQEKIEEVKAIPSYSTVEKPIIREKDYLDFFNQILNPNGLIIKENIQITKKDSSYWKSELIYLTEKTRDSVLSKILDLNDVKFMLEQEELQKNISIKPIRIDRKKITIQKLNDIESRYPDLDEYWNEIYKYGNGYYNLSLPVFSIDKKVAIFDYSYSCGSLCGEWTTFVYKKIDDKWEYIGWIGVKTVS